MAGGEAKEEEVSSAVFPALIGLAYPIARKPIFSTRVQRAVSGREVRLSDYPWPIWEWSLSFEYLPAADQQTLLGFIASRQGGYDDFLYNDPTDNSVSAQAIGTGDGATTQFQLVRSLGSLNEPILAPNVVSNVYLNGIAQLSSSYSVNGATGIVTFAAAPPSGTAVSADFSFYFRCRFREQSLGLEQFMNRIWRAKEVSFRSLFI